MHGVRFVSIVDPQQFCNLAQSQAVASTGGQKKTHKTKLKLFCSLNFVSCFFFFFFFPEVFFADQFENLANFQAHYTTTAPEIWKQTNQRLGAFVCGAGTGGTIAGVSRFLKEKDKGIKVFLADPVGSGLFNRVRKGVMFAVEEKEGTKGRHQVCSSVQNLVLGLRLMCE